MEYYDGDPLRHVADVVSMAADRYGGKTAFVSFGEGTTYAELETRVSKVADVLVDLGVREGERVALFLPNTDEFPAGYFGAIRAGAVPVPLNLRMDPDTLAYVIGNAGAEVMIGSWTLDEEVRDLAAAAGVDTLLLPGVSDDGVVDLAAAMGDADGGFEGPARAYDDVACQPYTSGTTGDPKGVLLTHENLLSAIEAFDHGALPIDAGDSTLLVLPLFHIYALNGIMGSYVYSGGTMYLQPRPEAGPMLSAIDEHDITHFAGVPAMFNMMWREYRGNPEEYDLSSLKFVTCGAAPLPDETRRTIEDAWNVPMTEAWGMTETSPAGTIEPVHGLRKSAGCVGPAFAVNEIKLADPETRETKISTDDLHPNVDEDIDFDDEGAVTGEIAIRGPNVFAGYYELPELTGAAFDDEDFFYTEDIARVDEDGYFWIVDRADDMIISGGENIYPAEVEDALYEHSDIEEAAVVGAPHEIKGEAPVAFVVTAEGAEVAERGIRAFSLEHVPTYAHPRRVFFREELPRSATQKVQRYKLEAAVDDRIDGALEPTEEEL